MTHLRIEQSSANYGGAGRRAGRGQCPSSVHSSYKGPETSRGATNPGLGVHREEKKGVRAVGWAPLRKPLHGAGRILVPRLGVEPSPSTVEAQSLNHGSSGKSHGCSGETRLEETVLLFLGWQKWQQPGQGSEHWGGSRRHCRGEAAGVTSQAPGLRHWWVLWCSLVLSPDLDLNWRCPKDVQVKMSGRHICRLSTSG